MVQNKKKFTLLYKWQNGDPLFYGVLESFEANETEAWLDHNRFTREERNCTEDELAYLLESDEAELAHAWARGRKI